MRADNTLILIADRSAVGLQREKGHTLRVGYNEGERLRRAQPEVLLDFIEETERLHPELVEGSINGTVGQAGSLPRTTREDSNVLDLIDDRSAVG